MLFTPFVALKCLATKILRKLWVSFGHGNRMLDRVNTGICILKLSPISDRFEIIYANQSAINILGYDPAGKALENALPQSTVKLPEYDFRSVADLYRDKLRSGIEVSRVFELQTRLYGLRYFEQDCLIYGPNTLLVTFTDISKTYSASITDDLTGLYTRVYLEDQIKNAIRRTSRDESYTFIRLDLNKFKRINDEGSHILGDKCLMIVSQRLRQVFRDSDIISRIGGDEFACLLPGDLHETQPVIDRLNNALKFEIVDEDTAKIFPVSAAIGMTVICKDDDYRTLDKRADRAQLRAKKTNVVEIELG